MRMLVPVLAALLVCSALVPSARSADKPGVVLMPVSLHGGISKENRTNYESAVARSLSGRYVVYTGSKVAEVVDKVMERESESMVEGGKCDLTSCLRKIANEFQVEYIAVTDVTKDDGDFHLSLKVVDVVDEHLEFSDAVSCEKCREAQVLEKLKTLASAAMGVPAPAGSVGFVSSAPTPGGGQAKVEMVKANVSGDPSATVSGLFITSDPAGADVLLNGITAGTTPYQNLELTPNQKIAVTLKKEQYHDKLLEFTLAPGMNKVTGVKMAPAFGSLSIASSPSGAEVWMAGSKVGTTPYRAEKVNSGQHLVTVKYPLYLPASNQVVVVEDGKETKQNFTLLANFGTLKVASKPSGTAVTALDGKGKEVAVGQTPFTENLEPGNYRLKIGGGEYEPVEANITIAAGKVVEIGESQATLRRLEGKVMVTTNPFDESALVYVDGKRVGNVPAELTLSAGTHEVMARTKTDEGKQTITVLDRKGLTVALKLKDRVMAGMVFVEGGCFQMGSDGGEDDEKPVHRVCLDDFQMDKYEITQAVYKKVMGDLPFLFSNKDCPDCPVDMVDWNQAKAYCEKVGKRLPTEAQWEYSARSGGKDEVYAGTSDEGRIGDFAWFKGNSSGDKMYPVGKKQPNGLGLYDMSGNAWEWVADWYGEHHYQQSPEENPEGPSSGSAKVVRGGSWLFEALSLRAANRDGVWPGSRFINLGFRCSR